MQFSIFTHDHMDSPPPGKSFSEVNGKLIKKTTGSLSRSKVETVELNTLSAFGDLLGKLDAKQHLLAGVNDHPECIAIPAVVLARQGLGIDAGTGLPLVARSNAFFRFPDGEGLMCVDSDSQGKTIGLDEVRDALVDACPILADIAMVQTTSSSSLVSGSVRSTGITGIHSFIRVQDARDIPRALTVLHKRLVLAGHGQHRVSKSGGFLERTLADRALRVPSQPIYVRASVGKSMKQTKQLRLVGNRDEALDTQKALPDLSVAEQLQFRELILKARNNLLTERLKVRKTFLAERAADLLKSGMSKGDAGLAAIAMLDDARLEPSVTLHFSNGDTVLVADILKDPERYHRRACLDPLEPDYNGGRTVAQFYATPQPAVHSFAHSAGDRGRVYRLSARAEFDALQGLGSVSPGKADISEAADAWIAAEKQDIARVQRALDLMELRTAKGVRVDASAVLM